ncbi:hypothetical protein ACP70R_025365 [Stipagrostis hirtigluma subsp. patula]
MNSKHGNQQDCSFSGSPAVGLMMIGSSIQSTVAKEETFCPMYCLNATHMTCPPNNKKQLQPVCNCCLAEKKGCTIYLADGGEEKCPP